MRKIGSVILILLMLLSRAAAEEPAAIDPFEAWFDAQYAQLVLPGVEAQQQRECGAVLTLPDGRQAQSLCLTVEGNLQFGRYAQVVRTALLDCESGAEVPPEAAFRDMDALQEFLDAYVEDNVLDSLNTYLDANDLLPVPLDAVCFDEGGVTFYYPRERFQFFSGHAGAVQLMWYELAEHLAVDVPETTFPLEPGGQIDALLETYGSVTDPDLVEGGEIYEFEAPALRGVQAIADTEGKVTAVRSVRFCRDGVTPGMTESEAEALLGAPDTVTQITAAAAPYLRLEAGTQAQYPDYTLYYNEAGVLYLMEHSLR